MPPKKKSGFWEFVLECRDKPQCRNMNMDEVKAHADQKWRNMTQEQREPYMQRAKVARSHDVGITKYTTDGIPIAQVEQEVKEKVNRENAMKTDIDDIVRKANLAENLKGTTFLSLHINYLIYHSSYDKYYVCEVAIAPFNLEKGVFKKDVFHEIVKPGALPLGLHGSAKINSDQTHQLLEVLDRNPDEDNTEQVFRKIISLLEKYTKGPMLPALYCSEDHMEMIEKVFESFCSEFGYKKNIRLYSIQYLLYALRNAVAKEKVWPSMTFSYREFEEDLFAHHSIISCDYHKLLDSSVYCSRSYAIRNVYTICNNCCNDLNIELKSGCHIPGERDGDDTAEETNVGIKVGGNKVAEGYSYRLAPLSSEPNFVTEDFPPLGSRSKPTGSKAGGGQQRPGGRKWFS